MTNTCIGRDWILWNKPSSTALETTVKYTNDDGTDFQNMEEEERREETAVIPPTFDLQSLSDDTDVGEFCTTPDDHTSTTDTIKMIHTIKQSIRNQAI